MLDSIIHVYLCMAIGGRAVSTLVLGESNGYTGGTIVNSGALVASGIPVLSSHGDMPGAAAVPEHTPFALLAAATIGLAAWRRRQQNP